MTIQPHSGERDKAREKIFSWFADLEIRRPELVGKIVPIITNLIGTKTFTPEKLVTYEPFINTGFKLLSDWLKRNGFPELHLKQGFFEEIATDAAATAAQLKFTFPTKAELYSRGGITTTEGPKVDA